MEEKGGRLEKERRYVMYMCQLHTKDVKIRCCRRVLIENQYISENKNTLNNDDSGREAGFVY